MILEVTTIAGKRFRQTRNHTLTPGDLERVIDKARADGYIHVDDDKIVRYEAIESIGKVG